MVTVLGCTYILEGEERQIYGLQNKEPFWVWWNQQCPFLLDANISLSTSIPIPTSIPLPHQHPSSQSMQP